jgi:hypothetical protein
LVDATAVKVITQTSLLNLACLVPLNSPPILTERVAGHPVLRQQRLGQQLHEYGKMTDMHRRRCVRQERGSADGITSIRRTK